MAFPMRDVDYMTLRNETNVPLPTLQESYGANNLVDTDHDDTTNVIIHEVPKNTGKIGGWTHIEDLDSFFTRIYNYYIEGGFYPMLISYILQNVQFIFVVWFATFLIHCVDYPKLFRDDPGYNRTEKVGLPDVIYPTSVCVQRISWQWWLLICVCCLIWFVRLLRSIHALYYAYDTKLFYNHALKIQDSDLAWINWYTVQTKAREAQYEERMCVQKREINELDIYHRILRFHNYLVAMVNKNILPLNINVPFLGEFHYLSKGLKFNLEQLLFSWPLSPWENRWQLQERYKDLSNRSVLAKQLEKRIIVVAFLNLLLSPLIQAWQILYFFFSYAELIKRSPGSLGLRTWSLYARIALRHFNELDHELQDRLLRAHKPATKYLASFTSPITTVIAKNVAFLSASVLGVLVVLSVYDEDVLTVEHVLTLITILGCVVAATRALITDEDGRYMTGAAAGEELLVQVLGHVHYLPADWRGRAHTKAVAQHFQQLFQFRAVHILYELLSPILCPIILYKLSLRSLDIVDFYRNFTVSVSGIGDVCSFAQLDIGRHGNPEWQVSPLVNDMRKRRVRNQYEQGEEGKTELSLLAFSCRNPEWKPQSEQRRFLKSLRQSMRAATNTSLHSLANNVNPTMLGSYLQQSMYGSNTPVPVILSYYQQKQQFKLPEMDETSDEDDDDPIMSNKVSSVTSQRATSQLGAMPQINENEPNEMSVSALHLYDIHLSQATQSRQNTDPCCYNNCAQQSSSHHKYSCKLSEDTPLLSKP